MCQGYIYSHEVMCDMFLYKKIVQMEAYDAVRSYVKTSEVTTQSSLTGERATVS